MVGKEKNMIELMIFGSVFLVIWGILDHKYGKVPTLLLLIPSGVSILFDPFSWVLIFYFPALLLLSLKILLESKKIKALGGADVISIPFAMFILVHAPFWVIVSFPVCLVVMIWISILRNKKDLRFCGTLAVAWMCSWPLYAIITLL